MPDDTTPHGGEALHPLPDRATIPKAREADRDPRTAAGAAAADPAQRPAPPEHPQAMPADHPGADRAARTQTGDVEGTGKPSVTRQPG